MGPPQVEGGPDPAPLRADARATDRAPAPPLAPTLAREPAPAPPVALYIHVPFCVSLCPYCDFVVYSGSAARGPAASIDTYLEALAIELDLRARLADARWGGPSASGRPALASVYLGGGTPSLVRPDALASLLERVGARFGIEDGAEITLEANPGADERGDPRALARAGATRLSFGVQSLDPVELGRLGRRHSPADPVRAIAEARDAGFPSVSLDLLYDIPGQTAASWNATLDGALALEADHLSLYALTLDDPDAEGSTGPVGDHLPTRTGARRWRERARAEQDEDLAADAYRAATLRLEGAGYVGYEISNWARPGHESRHNLAYWERRPYEAVGVGAHAFDGLDRRWNAARLGPYLEALRPGDGPPSLPPGGSERLDASATEAERVILGLRLATGIPAAWAEREPLTSTADWAIEHGLLETVGARLRLTLEGRLLSNEVFSRLV
jgi:putative oxygen-independent coproporphyrinogen III oxidase